MWLQCWWKPIWKDSLFNWIKIKRLHEKRINFNMWRMWIQNQRRAANKLHNQCAWCGLTLPSRSSVLAYIFAFLQILWQNEDNFMKKYSWKQALHKFMHMQIDRGCSLILSSTKRERGLGNAYIGRLGGEGGEAKYDIGWQKGECNANTDIETNETGN